MDSTQPQILHDYSPLLHIYSNGRVERLPGTAVVPPSFDPQTHVRSKDVVYSPEANLSARLYLPNNIAPNQKLPLLVYCHGGGFCIETAFSLTYHNYLNSLIAEANVVVVSIDYRRAPEDPIPIAYEDSWAALKWVASHFSGDGLEEWLNCRVDSRKVFFFAGDSAGANIAHQMTLRNGEEKLFGVSFLGIVLIHYYFRGKEHVGNEMHLLAEARAKLDALWLLACPTFSGSDDPLFNPVVDPKFGNLGCSTMRKLILSPLLVVLNTNAECLVCVGVLIKPG